MDELDRIIVNKLQDGLPVIKRPFDAVAKEIDIPVAEVLDRLNRLLEDGTLSRFGPLFHAEKMGGALTLCAMQVPETKFDLVAEQVNEFPEVAHNYARDHTLNMWFVIATECVEDLREVIARIERVTGCRIYNMPKLDEFYIGLKLAV